MTGDQYRRRSECENPINIMYFLGLSLRIFLLFEMLLNAIVWNSKTLNEGRFVLNRMLVEVVMVMIDETPTSIKLVCGLSTKRKPTTPPSLHFHTPITVCSSIFHFCMALGTLKFIRTKPGFFMSDSVYSSFLSTKMDECGKLSS